MTSKVYIDYVTPIDAASLNDFNNHVYSSTPISPATTVHPASVIANTPAGGIASVTVQAAINELDTEKANLASPTFTGVPLVPTAAPGTNTTQVASTAYATAADAVIQSGISTTVSTAVHAAASKATPVDADELYLLDSASTFSLAKLTWTNLKATLVTYLSALTSTWAISTTGNAATATTIAGTASTKLPTVGCTAATGALTFTASSQYLDFRSTTLTSGTPTTVLAAPSNLVLPSGGTLGAVTTIPARLIVVELNNAGTAELAVINLAGGNDLSETGIINTTAISASSTSSNIFYSTTARTGVSYRLVCSVDAVNTAGAWGSPTLVQPISGRALLYQMLTIPTQATTSGTSIDFTGFPSWVKRITVLLNGVSTNGTSQPQLQLGAGSVDTTGYVSSEGGINNAGVLGTLAAITTTGILISNNTVAADTLNGSITISTMGANLWVATGITGKGNATYVGIISGNKTLTGTIDRLRLTTVNGTDTFDAGSISLVLEGY